MLNNKNKLFFPKIVFEKSIELKHNTSEIKIINLYYLDWTNKEKKCNNGNIELPMEYEDVIKQLRYAITDDYLDEIRRVSWLSINEFNVIRKLDSSMKKIYLKPAVAYITTAFTLLGDCAFDLNTNFYYRGAYKVILKNLLLYKFWKNQRQITPSMILEFANIPELLTISMDETLTEEQMMFLNDFLYYVNNEINNNK